MLFPARRCVATALICLLFWEHPARADDPPIEAPAPITSTEVPYPQDAHGEASVVLEIVVETDGSVSSVDVVEGSPPFAEHARAAARGWRFVPARRGGRAIVAKTRARVDFRQEEIAPTPAPEVAAEEVTVRGAKREIGQMTMSAKDIREMPGAFGDPFRAVDALPGVTPIVSGLSYVFIRGAPPNNNGYFLDGVRVPQLFHVGLGPGIIHPGLVERVELYPSGAPARYGRVAGGIIAGSTREPASTFHGEANLRLFDTGALVESPFAGGRGTALAAARYGYPGPIVGLVSNVDLSYWDYQARTTWRAGERDTFGVFAFGSHDYLARVEANGVRVEDFVSDIHRIDLRYDRAIRDGRMRIATTLGYDTQGSASEANVAPTYLDNRSIGVRLELERRISEDLVARGGADARLDAYAFDQPASTHRLQVVVPSDVEPPPTNVTTGIYGDVVWKLAPRVEVVPGARLDVYSSTRAGENVTLPAVDPRLATRIALTRSVVWHSNVGLAHQYPALRAGGIQAIFLTGAGFPRTGSRELQRVAQTSHGVDVALPEDVTVGATAFLSGWSSLTDLTANCAQFVLPETTPSPTGQPPPTQFVCPNPNPVHGHAYGIELLVRRSFAKRLGVWLSYTLSRSQRAMHFLTPSLADAVATVASEFDRTHVLNAMLGYDLGRRWRAGGRFVFYTGAPYSKLSGTQPVPPYNAYRDPPFYRVDVRLEKRWSIGKDASIAFVLEGQNITLNKETSPVGVDCRGIGTRDTMTTECQRATIGPISIPSVGVEAFF